MRGKTSNLTLRQYLYFGSLERGYSATRAQKFVDRYEESHPHKDMNEKASWETWESRSETGILK